MERHPEGKIEIVEPNYPALMMVASHGRVLSAVAAFAVFVVLLLVQEAVGIGTVVVALFAGGAVFFIGLLLHDIAKLLVDTLVPK